MPASGSSIITDAVGYEASLQDVLDLVVPHPRGFQARLTWVDLPTLQLLRVQESTARVAHLRLPVEQVFVVFPSHPESRLIVAGVEVHFGEFVVHGIGERVHQRTLGSCHWAAISLPVTPLMAFGRAIADRDIATPAASQVLRVASATRQRLLRLHRQATRLAEKRLQSVAHHEVARGLDQDLIVSLVEVLIRGKPRPELPRFRNYARLMERFEAILDESAHGLLRIQDVCAALGITQHMLRTSCSEILGMAPMRYQRLRRLKLARAALARAAPPPLGSAEVLARYGFPSFHRFISEYWTTYGEMPPLPPRTIEP